MVSLWYLSLLALFLAICAISLAFGRRLGRVRTLTDGAAAAGVGAIVTALGLACYAVAARSSDAAVWLNAGALCFVMSPLVSSVVLSLTAVTRRWSRGSMLGSVLAGVLAVMLVWTWLTLYLKGVRGGWTSWEILVSLASVAVIFPSSACLGWWCGRGLGQKRA